MSYSYSSSDDTANASANASVIQQPSSSLLETYVPLSGSYSASIQPAYEYTSAPTTATSQILSDAMRSRSQAESVNQEPAVSNYLSSIEAAILRSAAPIDLLDANAEEISVSGQRGIWLNKAEVSNWRGAIPLSQYQINEDPNPEVNF